MFKVVTGNLLNETRGILVHGVNCQGAMGAGIALEVKKRYPKAYESYIAFGERNGWHPNLLLGQVDFVQISDELFIANAFIQASYGRSDFRYVSYDAVDECFSRIKQYAIYRELPVKYPRIGAGLANGNWDIVSAIIQANLPNSIDQTLFVL